MMVVQNKDWIELNLSLYTKERDEVYYGVSHVQGLKPNTLAR